MAIRIGHDSVAIAPELIHERHLHMSAGRDGAIKCCIDIVGVNVNGDRGSALRKRR